MKVTELDIDQIIPYVNNPRYCDVIIKRWETLTGKKAVRL